MDWFHLLIWIIVGIGTLLIDIITSAFLFVWFTVGAIAAMVAMAAGATFPVQLIVFIVVSSLFMATGYPIVKKNIKMAVPQTKTMEQQYIGMELTVEEDIIGKNNIKVGGIYWTVEKQGEDIKKGDRIKIIGIKGNKFIVQKVSN